MAETPLPFGDLVLVLKALERRALLVGGQAVAWWAYSYVERGRLGELAGHSMFVSGDVDYVNDGGRRELQPVLETLAEAVGGEIHHNEGGWIVPIVAANVVFEDSTSEPRQVDFLINVHGVKKRDELFDSAVLFEGSAELPDVYVMHPLLLLESRIANVVDLQKYRTDKGIGQAHVASWIVREWLLDALTERGWKWARPWIERTIRVSLSQKGIEAAARFDIDSFAAVPSVHESLPPKFLTERYRRERDRVDAAIAGYRGKPSFIDGR